MEAIKKILSRPPAGEAGKYEDRSILKRRKQKVYNHISPFKIKQFLLEHFGLPAQDFQIITICIKKTEELHFKTSPSTQF